MNTKYLLLICITLTLSACNQEQKSKTERVHSERHAQAEQRFKDWAYVAKEKQIAPGETLKLVIIPERNGIDLLDTKCLIYTNQEFKQTSMICPNADANQITE